MFLHKNLKQIAVKNGFFCAVTHNRKNLVFMITTQSPEKLPQCKTTVIYTPQDALSYTDNK